MKFNQYIALKEADQTQEINQIFTQAATDIQGLFDQLYRGTASMVRNYEKASLPEELQKQILQDLGKLAQKIKGMGNESPAAPAANTMTDPRGPSTPVPNKTPPAPGSKEWMRQRSAWTGKSSDFKPTAENVIINSFLNNIVENINFIVKEAESPSIVQDMGSHGKGVGGKPAYDFKSTITNTYRLVMDRMNQLKDAVFQHMGIIRDTHSKVLGLRTTAGQVRNKVDALSGQVGTGFSQMSSQPFSPEEEDKAQDSMIALADAIKTGFNIKLKGSDGKEIAIDPSSETWRQQVLKMGQKDKKFKLVSPDGQEEDVNIGNPNQVHQVLSNFGHRGSSDFVPKVHRKARSLGIRGQDGKVEKPENQ